MLIVPLAFLFGSFLQREERDSNKGLRHVRFLALACVITSIIAILFTHRIAKTTNSYSFFDTAITWIDTKSLLELLCGLLLTFGPLIVVLLYFPSVSLTFLKSRPELSFVIVAVTILSVVGGTNTELFWIWALPAVLAAIGYVFSQKKEILLSGFPVTLLCIAQVLSQRVFWNFPLSLESGKSSFVLFAPLGDAGYLELFSHFASTTTLQGVFLTNSTFILLFFLLMRVRSKAFGRSEPPRV